MVITASLTVAWFHFRNSSEPKELVAASAFRDGEMVVAGAYAHPGQRVFTRRRVFIVIKVAETQQTAFIRGLVDFLTPL